jgi:hypothetical protein
MSPENEIATVLKNLTDKDWHDLASLEKDLRSHTKAWGTLKGGDKLADGGITMPYMIADPLVQRFTETLYSKHLLISFDWPHWDAGRKMFDQQGYDKFADVSIVDALKLISAVIRNDRFVEGALVSLFRSGDAVRLLQRVLYFRPKSAPKPATKS